MRALQVSRHGPPEVLRVVEVPDPEPGPGEVRVRVHAAGLNFAEVAARQGLYPDAPRPPCVLGYEGAGRIDRLGPGVPEARHGQRVVFFSNFGAHAEYVVVPEQAAVPLPTGWSFERGAALPVNYATAWQLLFEVARLRPGDRVLVHMAAGGVGTAVAQLARTIPDVTLFGTASAAKHEHLRAQGYDHPIDYRCEDYAEAVRRIGDGEGVDFVLDPLGGRDWRKGYALLRPGGQLLAYGFANVVRGHRRRPLHVIGQLLRIPRFEPMRLMRENRGVAGVHMGTLANHPEALRRALEGVTRLAGEGALSPVIDGVHPFEAAAEAHRRIETRANVGKLILRPPGSPPDGAS